jgi:hypothetical protein
LHGLSSSTLLCPTPRPSPFLLLPLLSCFAVLVSTMTGPALAMTGAADQVATDSLLDFRMMHATFARDASYSIPMVVLLRNTPTSSAGTPCRNYVVLLVQMATRLCVWG